MDTCSTTHLAPLVRLLQAPIVVGMGVSGWRAVREIFGLHAEPSGIKAVAGRNWMVAGTRVFAVGHCGRLGLANRPPHLQAEDWRRIGAAFAALQEHSEEQNYGNCDSLKVQQDG